MAQQCRFFKVVSTDHLKRILNPKDVLSPFKDYVGNVKSVNLAITIAKPCFASLVRVKNQILCDRRNPFRMLITGPRSVGKSSFARKLHSLIGTEYTTGKIILPWVEMDGTRITSDKKILEKIEEALNFYECPLEVDGRGGSILPPMTIFIDEVHAVSASIKEKLLKMCEKNDGMFEVGGRVIDCRLASIIFATTDPGDLKPALLSRFPVKLEMKIHTIEEIGQIICNEFPDFSKSLAVKLARMKPIPREAKDIAELIVKLAKVDNITVKKAFGLIKNQLGLDNDGLSERALEVLVVLAETPKGLSKRNICAAMQNMEVEEFDRVLMAQLLKTQTHDALVTVGVRHQITEAGMRELEKRGIFSKRP